MKVLAAMSGGVDSAVAGAAVEAGRVTGSIWPCQESADLSFGAGCCSIEAHDARRAADVLGIPSTYGISRTASPLTW
jgi:tRNA U34 2-thiouridine synthase MnmA/TrmU